MSQPVLVDLYCCAGGASMGYHRAGFRVIGFDKDPQPNYPFEFHQVDVLSLTVDDLLSLDPAAVAASPPCQFATAYRRRKGVAVGAVNLIPQTRALVQATGLPYVIENVEQARAHLRNPVRCCGTSLGVDIRRHRYFESNEPLVGIPCDHAAQAARSPGYPQATNRTNRRATIEVGVRRIPLATQQRHMGMDWTTREELSQAVPPVYTEHLGTQLLASLAAERAA